MTLYEGKFKIHQQLSSLSIKMMTVTEDVIVGIDGDGLLWQISTNEEQKPEVSLHVNSLH